MHQPGIGRGEQAVKGNGMTLPSTGYHRSATIIENYQLTPRDQTRCTKERQYENQQHGKMRRICSERAYIFYEHQQRLKMRASCEIRGNYSWRKANHVSQRYRCRQSLAWGRWCRTVGPTPWSAFRSSYQPYRKGGDWSGLQQ